LGPKIIVIAETKVFKIFSLVWQLLKRIVKIDWTCSFLLVNNLDELPRWA